MVQLQRFRNQNDHRLSQARQKVTRSHKIASQRKGGGGTTFAGDVRSTILGAVQVVAAECHTENHTFTARAGSASLRDSDDNLEVTQGTPGPARGMPGRIRPSRVHCREVAKVSYEYHASTARAGSPRLREGLALTLKLHRVHSGSNQAQCQVVASFRGRCRECIWW
jgi:hypothetical protein